MTGRSGLRYHSAAAFVRDIAASKKFYTEVLGLSVESDFGKNVILAGGITLWEMNPDHIIAGRLGIDAIARQSVNRFEYYFETEDLETVQEKVRASGAEFLHPQHEEPWGQRTIRFFDPDRHLIEVGEAMDVFVRRLSGDRMTPEQVSEKTSIPLEKVRELLKG
jgi:catechol 2,3-dioxygenase-like lactoylglutathione lyase family enzyme